MFAQDAYAANVGPHDYTRAVLRAEPLPKRRLAGSRKPRAAHALACLAAAVALGLGIRLVVDVAPERHREQRPVDRQRSRSPPQNA